MTPTLTAPNNGTDATQEHPEQLPSEEPESPYGERNEQLPEQLVIALKACIKEFSQQEMYVRRREVMRDRLNRFYERGYQHVYQNNRTGGFSQGAPGGTVSVEGREIQCPNYIDDYNIFQPFERIIEAILTQNPPGIDFRPVNPNLSEDMESAETAEGYRKMFDRANKVKSMQTQIVRMMCLSARTVLWTRTEANAQKFGYEDDGTTPKSMETATVHGTLENRVSILSRSQEDTGYCILFDDPDVKQAKAEYPAFKDKLKPGAAGIGENAYERLARLGALQGTPGQAQIGDAYSHLCTRQHCWLRPSCFEGEYYEEDFTGEDISVREKLLELFPLGVHVVFVGEEYVGSWAESMDDAIVIGFPYEGDGMFRLAIMDPMVVVQDRFNDCMNAAAEVFDMGWPSTWVDAEDTEFDAITSQKADPYAIRQIKGKSGMKAGDRFYREPNPELPGTFLTFMENLQAQLPQFILATPPAVFGAAMADQKTASGYAQARAQAMGQLGLIWGNIQDMMARMYYQAALCAARNPQHSEEIVIPGDGGQNAVIRLDRLTKGKFGAYPDEDSSFPESTSQKRATLGSVLTLAQASPAIGQQLLSSPDNWKTFNTINGFPELVIPEAESRDKQQFEIEELLKGAPIPNPQALMVAQQQHAAAAMQARATGGVPPPFDAQQVEEDTSDPSVPVEELDYHQWEFEKCKEWLSSGARRRQDAEGNQTGVSNVKLHAMQHQKFMQLMAPPPQAPVVAPGMRPPPPPPQPVAPSFGTM